MELVTSPRMGRVCSQHGCRLTCAWSLVSVVSTVFVQFLAFGGIFYHKITHFWLLLVTFVDQMCLIWIFEPLIDTKWSPSTPSAMTSDAVAFSQLFHQLLLVTFQYFHTYQTYSPAPGFSFSMKFKLKKHLWCPKIEQSKPALLKPNLGHKTKMNIIILPPNPKTDSQTLNCTALTPSLQI